MAYGSLTVNLISIWSCPDRYLPTSVHEQCHQTNCFQPSQDFIKYKFCLLGQLKQSLKSLTLIFPSPTRCKIISSTTLSVNTSPIMKNKLIILILIHCENLVYLMILYENSQPQSNVTTISFLKLQLRINCYRSSDLTQTFKLFQIRNFKLPRFLIRLIRFAIGVI